MEAWTKTSVALVFLFAGIVLGVAVDVVISSKEWKGDVIEHGCAHYDQATGKFEWGPPVTGETK